ncbi:hypothetical protein [Mucilaginibacter phyllosphaerae]
MMAMAIHKAGKTEVISQEGLPFSILRGFWFELISESVRSNLFGKSSVYTWLYNLSSTHTALLMQEWTLEKVEQLKHNNQ